MVVRLRGRGENCFVKNIIVEMSFVENNADVIVRKKQHGRQSNTIHLGSRRSRQDRLLTIFKRSLKNKTHLGY